MCLRSLILAAMILVGGPLGFPAPASATTFIFDCTQPANSGSGALQTFIGANAGPGDTVDVKGTCLGDVSLFQIAMELLGDAGVPGTIMGHVNINNLYIQVNNLTIDGTGSADTGGGLVAGGTGANALVTNCIIENWAFANVGIYQGAVLSLNDVTLQNSAGSALNVGQATVNVIGGTIETSQNGNPGVNLFQGANAQFSGTTIQNNTGAGIAVYEGSTVHLGSQGPVDPSQAVNITGNQQGGIGANDNAQVFINQAYIHANTGGPAITLVHSSADINAGTVSSPASVTVPTILMLRSGLQLSGPSLTVTGSGHSNAIYAIENSSLSMFDATVTDNDASDPTVFFGDGSALISAGGNNISNSLAGGAMTLSNASMFHQHIAKQFGIPAGADAITGAGTVQIESNMELGTGSTTPSTWTGAISVAQNSSFRMDGGITVTSTVKLTQASNGFFNVSNTGENIVTGGVTCPATTNPSSHVAGNTVVLLAHLGASAVTIGNTPPQCLGF